MALKDILVHVDNDERGALRARLAVDLARRHEAHLTGLGVSGFTVVPSFVDAELPTEIVQAHIEASRVEAEAAGDSFRAAADQAGIGVEWRVVEQPVADVARVVALHARHADLTVMGQPDPEADGRSLSLDIVERLLLDAGGPVLLIPYAGRFEVLGGHVMLAWNGSREAARAVRDSLPFLAKGTQVTVLRVNPPGRDPGERDIGGADIAVHLARHGLEVEVAHVVAKDMNVGDMILSRAADAGADMIVMGAYGHSRLREMVLGGATRHILQHMTVPVLMSH
ncbi:MAG: universal stress protein [Rhodospirillaceae bacterium]|nr:universal stress protein [Rhodospirillaceae bacterium]